MKNNITKFSVYEAAPLAEKKVVFTFGRFNPPTTGHEKLIDKVIDNNRDKATEYKSGKVKLLGFFVGQVMKESGGKANPQLVNKILKKKL